jgi:hypothetical protein
LQADRFNEGVIMRSDRVSAAREPRKGEGMLGECRYGSVLEDACMAFLLIFLEGSPGPSRGLGDFLPNGIGVAIRRAKFPSTAQARRPPASAGSAGS